MRPLLALIAFSPFALALMNRADPPPRVVVSWPSGPLEVRVSLDRPLPPDLLDALTNGTIPFADRTSRPEPTPLGTLNVAEAQLEDDGRTLVLATDPHPFSAIYTPSLPALPTVPPYSLGGVLVEFEAENSHEFASSWWPGLDSESTEVLAKAGSVAHRKFLSALNAPGLLTVRTMVSLPEGSVELQLASNRAIEEPSLGGEGAEVREDGEGTAAELRVESTGEPMELIFDVRTAAGPFRLSATCRVEGAEKPIPSDHLALPWAPAPPRPLSAIPAFPASMAGGDPSRGEAVYFGEAAKCSACHAIRGKGGQVGPDLSDLSRKDPAMVYRDILDPSAAIHPDYVPYIVNTNEGRVVAGVARSEGKDAIRVVGTDARVVVVKRLEIEEIRPSATSIMPVGLPGAIGEAGMRDLMAYLLEHR